MKKFEVKMKALIQEIAVDMVPTIQKVSHVFIVPTIRKVSHVVMVHTLL